MYQNHHPLLDYSGCPVLQFLQFIQHSGSTGAPYRAIVVEMRLYYTFIHAVKRAKGNISFGVFQQTRTPAKLFPECS